MKIRKLFCVTIVIALFVSLAGVSFAGDYGIMASDVFSKASVSLNSSMTATFSATTTSSTTVSVTSCTLQKKVDGAWQSAGSLTAPPSSTGVLYTKEKDYSGSCSTGVTYRVAATFSAGGEKLTKYSNEVKY